jgi:hypothetical protein
MNVSASRLSQMIFHKTKQISTKPYEISVEYIVGRYKMMKQIPNISQKYNTSFDKPKDSIRHVKHNWLSGKPDGISNDNKYILKLKYTEGPRLCISYYDWIYTQVIMEISNVDSCVYSIGTSEKYNTFLINRERKWWNIVEKAMIRNGTINIHNSRATRQSTPFIIDKVPAYNLHPYFHGDLLSYSLFLKNTRNEKSASQLYQMKEFQKKYSDLLSLNIGMNKNCAIIPLSYKYVEYFETLTINHLHDGVSTVFNPMVSFNGYYHQSFALMRTECGYYTLAVMAKKTDKFIDVMAKNIYHWCDIHGIPHTTEFNLVSTDTDISIIPLKADVKLISDYHIPTTFKLNKNGVIPIKNAKYFQSIHRDIIEKTHNVSKLMGIGPVRARELHALNINTIYEFIESDESKTPHQENILLANTTDYIYPETLEFDEILKESPNEMFIDAEFCPGRIVTFVSKDTAGNVKKWKLSEFTDHAERIMVKEIIDAMNSADIVYHWGHADRTQITKAIARLNMVEVVPNMCDAYALLKMNNIGIPGCWNMKLKSVAKALYDNNCIDTFHEDVLDGQDMVCQFNKWNKQIEFYDNNGDIIQKILKYNYYDVETMKQIIEWVRSTYA